MPEAVVALYNSLDEMAQQEVRDFMIFLAAKRSARSSCQASGLDEAAAQEPLCLEALTKEERDAEIQKGFDDIAADRVYSASQVREELSREFAS